MKGIGERDHVPASNALELLTVAFNAIGAFFVAAPERLELEMVGTFRRVRVAQDEVRFLDAGNRVLHKDLPRSFRDVLYKSLNGGSNDHVFRSNAGKDGGKQICPRANAFFDHTKPVLECRVVHARQRRSIVCASKDQTRHGQRASVFARATPAISGIARSGGARRNG